MTEKTKKKPTAREVLTEALILTKQARVCIAQNRGLEKEQAREAYEHVVATELTPAIEAAAGVFEDAEPRDVEALAEAILRVMKARGVDRLITANKTKG